MAHSPGVQVLPVPLGRTIQNPRPFECAVFCCLYDRFSRHRRHLKPLCDHIHYPEIGGNRINEGPVQIEDQRLKEKSAVLASSPEEYAGPINPFVPPERLIPQKKGNLVPVSQIQCLPQADWGYDLNDLIGMNPHLFCRKNEGA